MSCHIMGLVLLTATTMGAGPPQEAPRAGSRQPVQQAAPAGYYGPTSGEARSFSRFADSQGYSTDSVEPYSGPMASTEQVARQRQPARQVPGENQTGPNPRRYGAVQPTRYTAEPIADRVGEEVAPPTRGAPSARSPATGMRPIPNDDYANEGDMQYGGPMDYDGGPGGCADCWNDDCHSGYCGPGGCIGTCGQPNWFWVRGEYLVWWGRGTTLPPLVTTSVPGTAQNEAGILGLPSTSVLLGNEDEVGDGARSGGRFTFGWWIDNCQHEGIELIFFGLGSESDNFNFSSDGSEDSQILARPFTDITVPEQAAQLIAFPEELSGFVNVRSESEVYGGEVNYRVNCDNGRCNWRNDLILGYRFARLNESLTIDDSLTVLPSGGTVPQGTVISGTDLFDAENEFHGGQIGWIHEARHCNWSMELMLKIAFGDMREKVTINGSTTIAVPNLAPETREGALLAQPTNIGDYERNQFAVIPELGVNLWYNMTPCWRAGMGYTFIYFSDVVRPSDQIDVGINPSQIDGPLVGPARPEFNFVGSHYWLQGLNFGLEYKF